MIDLQRVFQHYRPQVYERGRVMKINGLRVDIADLVYYPDHIEFHADLYYGHFQRVLASEYSLLEEIHARLEAWTNLSFEPFRLMDNGEEYEAILKAQDAMDKLCS